MDKNVPAGIKGIELPIDFAPLTIFRSDGEFRPVPDRIGRLFRWLLLFVVLAGGTVSAQIGGTGWVRAPVTFNVQSPTNVPQDERYFFTNNIYHCLVYSNDGAFSVGNTTLPRTEQRFTPDYTRGEIQYQSIEMAPSNENSYCVFQIHTGDAQSPTYGSTTFMLFWFTNDDGSVHDYSGSELAGKLGNKWFQLNVDHNLANRTIKVWINKSMVWTQEDNGAGDFYFKDGAYEQDHGPTYEMDTYITNILIWTNSAILPLTWLGETNGVNTGTWNLGTTADWADPTNGAVEVYQDGSAATFSDNAPGATTVNLQGQLLPGSVTVNNTVKNYTFTGSGSLGGACALTKFGGGTLTVDTTNSFTGGTKIQGGLVIMGNAEALGLTGGTTVVTNGGTLDVDGNDLGAESVVVSGWGVSSNGALVSSGTSAQDDALEHVTLTGDTAFGGPGNWLASGNPGRWDIRGSGTTLSTGGEAYNLYKVGSNQVSIVGVKVDAALGNIEIRQGMLGFEDGSTSMGNPTNTLTVDAGGTLEFYQSSALSNSYTKQFVLYGGGATPCITNWAGGGSTTISGPMTLNGGCVIGVNGTSLTNDCTIVGGGSLIKEGAEPLALGGVNTYTGDTTVGGGSLLVTGNGSIPGSAVMTVASGATLDASQRSDGTLTVVSGQELTGDGTVKGNVIVSAGATLAPGGGLTTMTFNNNLTLNGGTTTVMEVAPAGSSDTAQVGGSLTYGGTLAITNVTSNSFSAGDSFKLFNAGAYSGTFGATNLPPLNAGEAWNWDPASGTLSVVSAPAPTVSPVITGFGIVGGNVVIGGTNAQAGAIYYLLTSTNLLLPVSQWQAVSTNTPTGTNSFSFTASNAVFPGDLQQFYIISATNQ